MRIDRMLAIVVLLLNRKSITARELADRFEISLRTVYRDIDAINDAGIPVVSSQGYGGGYSIMENFRLHHQFFSLENIRSILSALKGVNTTLQDRELSLTMEKIRNLVPAENKPELDSKLEQFVVDFVPWGFNAQLQSRIQEIHRAIAESCLITLTYQNLKAEISYREVEPMTLIFKGQNWYLFAYCRLKQDGRVFRLTRIRELTIQREHFKRRELSFRDFFDQSQPPVQQLELELRFDAVVRFQVEEFFYLEQIRENADGSLTVNVAFPEDQWLFSMILSYGEHVEVIQPLHLRRTINNIAQKIQIRNRT